jgi:hypothetical protein
MLLALIVQKYKYWLPPQRVHTREHQHCARPTVCSQFAACFTSTKVQILTQESLVVCDVYMRTSLPLAALPSGSGSSIEV